MKKVRNWKAILIIFSTLIIFESPNPQAQAKSLEAFTRLFVKQIFNEKWKVDNANGFIGPNFIDHNLSPEPGPGPGLEGVKQFIIKLRTSFPDHHITIEDTVKEMNKIVVLYTASGTHKGEFMGIVPTAKQVRVAGIDLLRFDRAKIVERWSNFDQLGLMRQLGVIPMLSAQINDSITQKEPTLTYTPMLGSITPAKQSKDVVRRFFEEVLNKGNLTVMDEIFADNCVGYHPASSRSVKGLEGIKQFLISFRTAFPDIHLKVEDEVAESGKVAVRWTAFGIHKGEFMGLAPTGKQMMVTGISVFRILNVKIVEVRASENTLGMMQQLGVIPAVGQDGKQLPVAGR